jgi:Glycosyltransferase family 87
LSQGARALTAPNEPPSTLDPVDPGQETVRPEPATLDGVVDSRDRSLMIFGGTILASFLVAFFIWWILYQYHQQPGQLYGLGFWVPRDRPSWLPKHSGYGPLVGQHYFGDFFQLYYAVRTHAPYTNRIDPTSVNPGYLLPPSLVAWLPYPAGGFVYMIALLAAWVVPAIAIARRNIFIALVYFIAASLSVPGLLSIDIGQPEVFLYALAIGAFYYLDRRPNTSIVLLGLAIAIKPYMALFVLILLFRKQYRFALWSVAIAGIVNFATALYLVRGKALSGHLWSVILHASAGYGSGNGLRTWDQAPFLHFNASMYGLFYTLSSLNLPVVSSIARVLADHYSPFSLAFLIVSLVVLWRVQRRLTVEVQWIYISAVFLLVPSFTIGYAWLLLFVPFVSAAIAKSYRPPADRVGLFQNRLIVTAVALSVVAYPAIVALPATLRASNPVLSPTANVFMTPALLVFVLGAIVWSARKFDVRRNRELDPAESIVPVSRQARHRMRNSRSTSPLGGLGWKVGWPLLAVVGCQITASTVAFALSVPASATTFGLRSWTGVWIRARHEVPRPQQNVFTLREEGGRLVGVMPWLGCLPGGETMSGSISPSGTSANFVLLGTIPTSSGPLPVEIGTQTLQLIDYSKRFVGQWRIVQSVGSCKAGEKGGISGARPKGT